jgi:hypothetical protein
MAKTIREALSREATDRDRENFARFEPLFASGASVASQGPGMTAPLSAAPARTPTRRATPKKELRLAASSRKPAKATLIREVRSRQINDRDREAFARFEPLFERRASED